MTAPAYLVKSAHLSGDERYRYRLDRQWEPPYTAPMVVVMLNPSTADAMQDDPTIRRCVSLAQRWGSGAIEVYNLFAYRAADPRTLVRAWRGGEDIVGPLNDGISSDAIAASDLVLAAWGSVQGPADWLRFVADRANEVMSWRPEKWHAFAETDAGHPRHPLFLPATVLDGGIPSFEPNPFEGPYATAAHR